MRLKEFQPQVNPFSDQDMQLITEAHKSGKWSEPMSLEEALADLDRIMGDDNASTNQIL